MSAPERRQSRRAAPTQYHGCASEVRALSAALTFEVAPSEAGRRLDVVLVARVEGMSRARARRLTEAGTVRVNGKRARKGRTVSAGDSISLEELPSPPSFAALPDMDLPLSVLYEDPHIVVINKEPGVPTHPLRENEVGTAASALVARYPEMAIVGYSPREPGILHRLDIGTSGVLLAARSDEAFEGLRDALVRGRIDKRYVALCEGTVETPAVIEAPIAADPGDRRRVAVFDKSVAPSGARHARTELLGAVAIGAMSLVEVRARTGARHQVRAHLAFAGHPLAGDVLYGGPTVTGLHAHFLHASRLVLTHPVSGELLDVEAPLPARRRAILDEARGA